MNVGIVGLGYVGLPLACFCAKNGHKVIGIDIDTKIVDKLNNDVNNMTDGSLEKGSINAFHSYNPIADCDIIIVCVPTPVDKNHLPDMKALKSSCENIAKYLKNGSSVVIESTIYPGTMEEVIIPIFKKAGFVPGRDFYLGHCPERIDPGNKKWTLKNIPRNLAAFSEEGTKRILKFYKSFIEAEVTALSSVRVVEATKIVENTFRDVNIAFVNELAKSFDKLNIDLLEVMNGASSKPFAFLSHYPGCGVGGHCISVDPYYLIEQAKKHGFRHEFLILAREINKSMPGYAVELLGNFAKKENTSLQGARVGVLGLSYKPNVSDTRESPSYDIISELRKKGALIEIFDPFVPGESTADSLLKLLSRVDYLILATAHPEFKNMDLSLLRKNDIKAIIDGRNCLDKDKIKELGVYYKGIGH